MNFSLAAKSQEKEAAVPMAKQSWLSPLKDETYKSESVAFACMSRWIARHIH
jgi:hypothetical protein